MSAASASTTVSFRMLLARHNQPLRTDRASRIGRVPPFRGFLVFHTAFGASVTAIWSGVSHSCQQRESSGHQPAVNTASAPQSKALRTSAVVGWNPFARIGLLVSRLASSSHFHEPPHNSFVWMLTMSPCSAIANISYRDIGDTHPNGLRSLTSKMQNRSRHANSCLTALVVVGSIMRSSYCTVGAVVLESFQWS